MRSQRVLLWAVCVLATTFGVTGCTNCLGSGGGSRGDECGGAGQELCGLDLLCCEGFCTPAVFLGDRQYCPGEEPGLGDPCLDYNGCLEAGHDLVCCNNECVDAVFADGARRCPNCDESGGCAEDECCVLDESQVSPDLGYCLPDVHAACPAEGGGGAGASGGTSATGGTGGTAGMGGAGGMSTTGLPPYTVLSGSPVVNAEGCLVNAGPGVLPAQIVLDEVIAGPITITVEGTLTPVPAGVGVDALSVVQVCTGGIVNGNLLDGCHLARNDYHIVLNTAGAKIYDTGFVEIDAQAWTPTAQTHAFVQIVDADTAAQTSTINVSIDGTPVATATGGTLGAAGGARIGILMAQAIVCDIGTMQ